MTIEGFYPVFLEFPDICIDSRAAKPGSVFVALKGDNANGNSYAAKALEMGCARAIVDESAWVKDDRYVLVDNALTFLQDLAAYHRTKMNIPVLAITGTNGKTTSKELIAAVLSSQYKIVATQGNFNNHIGLPLTLLRIRPDDEIAVLEMGANHVGEISKLCSIAQPTMGLITNVSPAHIEGFGSFDGVIKAKNELYSYLKERDGIIFFNQSDTILSRLIGDYPALPYNKKTDSAINAETVRTYYLGFNYYPHPAGDTDAIRVETHLVGSYNLQNVLAAMEIGRYFGISPERAARELSAYQPGMNRSQYMKTGANEIILDAYNANPVSMREALQNFINIRHENKLLILGEMLEMGEQSRAAHKEILEIVIDARLNCMFVGSEFAKLEGAENYKCFVSSEELAAYLNEHPVSGKLVLLKASRGIKLELVISSL
ncbi:MAG: UDP-N-acetylmuramoyl-tripeptide--D-alanyl-D-alanine ligase [Bacteroidales bacterium]|nr:UDP-N-acetylmuramoyl-tripeptide--D-alanyl-D-alanine ligase [Bacteroidales bacterium]